MTSRADDIAASVATVRARIDRACVAAGREPTEVELLPVTKTFPAIDVAHLLDLGHRVFGEAREQEAVAKIDEVAALRPDIVARWVVLGRLQRNKSRSVARWATAVHSMDTPRLLRALDRGVGAAREAGEREDALDVLVQISLDGDPERGGCPLPQVPALADLAAEADHLRLRGLMVVLPQDADEDLSFAATQRLAAAVREDHPGAVELSAGMSGDLEAAVRHGSTCVRVGTALLGTRPLPSAQAQQGGLPQAR